MRPLITRGLYQNHAQLVEVAAETEGILTDLKTNSPKEEPLSSATTLAKGKSKKEDFNMAKEKNKREVFNIYSSSS